MHALYCYLLAHRLQSVDDVALRTRRHLRFVATGRGVGVLAVFDYVLNVGEAGLELLEGGRRLGKDHRKPTVVNVQMLLYLLPQRIVN